MSTKNTQVSKLKKKVHMHNKKNKKNKKKQQKKPPTTRGIK